LILYGKSSVRNCKRCRYVLCQPFL